MSLRERIINKAKDIGNKKRPPKLVVLLRTFGIILYLFLIFLLALTLGTTEKGLEGLTHSFVEGKEVDEKYYEHYYEYGFTKDQCVSLLEGEGIKYLTADIMTERLRAIFRNTKSYSITLDEAKSSIREEVVKVMGEGMDETSLSAVTDYTADISGISTMFWYDTPDQYRTAIFDASKTDAEMSNSLLHTLATLSSPMFMVLILLMFLSILVLLYFFDKGNRKLSFLNIALYPALAVLGFSIGEVFMPDASEVTDYIFRLVAASSIIGILFGIVIFVLVWLMEDRSEKEEVL